MFCCWFWNKDLLRVLCGGQELEAGAGAWARAMDRCGVGGLALGGGLGADARLRTGVEVVKEKDGGDMEEQESEDRGDMDGGKGKWQGTVRYVGEVVE